ALRGYAKQFALRIAQHLAQPRIHSQYRVVVDITVHDADRRAVERGAIALVRLLALGDVLDHADDVLGLARRVAGRRHRTPRPQHATVLAHEALFSRPGLGGAIHELRPVLLSL